MVRVIIKTVNMKVFRSLIVNGVCICISLIFFAKEIFPLALYVIVTAISFVFIFLSVVLDLIPHIFSHNKKREENETVLLPKVGWLLFLTKNMGLTIRNLYVMIVVIVACFYVFNNEIPRIISYFYWLIFGAYFGVKVVYYSNLYQRKYTSDKIEK